MFPSIAFAQLSPGPLSAAHEELEGVKNCLKCHGVKETRVDPHCLDCHGEIARLRADGRGFHARDAAGACADCHLEHGGREFELIHWDEGSAKDFDHSRTGWNLTGKHAEAECEACHTAAFQKSPTFDLRPAGSGERSWLGLETGCVNCHVDPHEDRFGQDCAQCHLTSKWQDLVEASFDHDRTRYPLRGAHVKVQCSDCHKNGFAELPRFDECRSCHEDPHDGKATLAGAKVDCASCHLVDHFAPATWDVARHANTKMPLEGKHREVSCKGCHGEGKKFDFRPKFAACADCHEDAHAGQLAKIDKGRCDSCHDVKGFLPSSFTVARHQDSWKLEGAHADAKCRACHGPERTNLPPLPGIAVTGKAGALFRMGDVACITCHADPHRGELGTKDDDCRKCHDPAAFRPSLVDPVLHSKFEFKLEGAHGAVPCLECHLELTQEMPRTSLAARHVASDYALKFEKKHDTCAECHEDPHGGQFAGRDRGSDCGVCHGSAAFRP
ncbi:MAG: cytochrome c3 family protein, partial [Gemmatimonadetes bacterium]|nr:cytochrome c3 family protein [Gemmatimonadota bacterium]